MRVGSADYARGRRRHIHGFREGLRCGLCGSGPFTNRRQRLEHEKGTKHHRKFEEYNRGYDEADPNWQRNQTVLRIAQEQKIADQETLVRVKKFRDKIVHLKNRGFYSYDLTNLKAAAFDFIVNDSGSRQLDIAMTIHERKVTLDLLVLGFVRSRLIVQFGSVDEARMQSALQHQAAASLPANVTAGAIWLETLSKAGNFGQLIRTLVMPFLSDQDSHLSH